jgi:hypothetical protein
MQRNCRPSVKFEIYLTIDYLTTGRVPVVFYCHLRDRRHALSVVLFCSKANKISIF